jgi:hypothetical protein
MIRRRILFQEVATTRRPAMYLANTYPLHLPNQLQEIGNAADLFPGLVQQFYSKSL